MTKAAGEAPAGVDPPQAAAKPPVLLLHGLTGAPADLQTISRAMKQAHFPLSVPMLPGHGVGEKELLATTWRDWLAASEAELLRLTQSGGRAFVGGLSMGAILGLALAIKHPERVAGVLCFAPTLRYDGWVAPAGAWFIPIGAYIPIVNRYRFRERPPYGIKDERLRAKMAELLMSGAVVEAGLPFMPGRSLAQNLSLIGWTKKRLAQVKAPVFIAHSTHDDITHVRNAKALAAAVSGPVEALYLEDSYHLVTLDRERNKVAHAAVAFVKKWSVETPKH